jgi:hypothetical protein
MATPPIGSIYPMTIWQYSMNSSMFGYMVPAKGKRRRQLGLSGLL